MDHDILSAIFDSLSAHVVLLDRFGRVEHASRSWLTFARENGANETSVGRGVDYLEICRHAAQQDDPIAQAAIEAIEAVLARRLPRMSLEYPCHEPGPSGRRRYFLVNVDPMPIEHGGVVITHTDITQRVEAEQALRQSEQQYRNLVEEQTDLICRFRPDTTLTFVNVPYARQYGRSVDELIGESFLNHIPVSSRPATERYIQSLCETPRTGSFEHEVVTVDGIRWQHWVDRPIVGPDGKVVEFQSVGRDVTARKQGERALHESEAKFRGIYDSNLVPISFWHADGRVSEANDAYLRLTGFTRAELEAGKLRWKDLTPPESLALDEEALKTMQRTAGFPPFEKEYRLRDGRRVPVLIGGGLLPGHADRGVSFALDLTERKQAEGKLRESQRHYALATAAGGVSVWEIDIASGAVRTDPVLPQHLGIAVAESYSRDFWLRLIHPDDLERILEHEDQVNTISAPTDEEGNTAIPEIEFRVLDSAGATRWFLLRGTVFRDSDGRAYRSRGTIMDITERKLVADKVEAIEAYARHEHQRLNEIVASVPGVVWEAKGGPDVTERKATFISEYIEVMSGYSVQEWQSRPNFWISIVHEEDRERAFRERAELLAGGRDGSYQYRWVRKDGRVIWVETHLVVIHDETGKSIGVRGVTMDITERKKAEEALRQSETKNRAILEAIPDLMFIQNKDGVYLDYYAKEPEHLYVPPETFLGKNMRDILPPELAEALARCLVKAEESGETVVHEYALRIGGKTHHHEARIIASDNDKIITIARDISQRKRAEQALRESEERLKLALEAGRMGVWDWDPGTEFLNWSKEVFTVMGLEPFSVKPTYQTWAERVHPDDFSVVNAAMERAIAEKKEYRSEYRVVWADGTVCWVVSRGMPAYDAEGRCKRIMGLIVDVTEAKVAEEEIRRLKERLEAENVYLREEVSRVHRFGEIIGRSDAMTAVLRQAEQVAPTDTTVLILGETGTGKELLARAVHARSKRSDRPLVTVNCAALPGSLIESELFGHEKGSFTGAAGRRVGRFELADGATIFLDEIGDLPLELQVKLLRVLQEGEFERLGSSKTIKVDVRVIAATNRDLRRAMAERKFREDLYYRLNVYPISLPPLRERKEDIAPLAMSFLTECSRRLGRPFSGLSLAVLAALQRYDWPGNVRELQNVIERAAVISRGKVLRLPEHWEMIGLHEVTTDQPQLSRNNEVRLEQIERSHILRILELTHWRIEGMCGAAAVLGLKPSTLRSRMQKVGIRRVERETPATPANNPPKPPPRILN